MMNNKRLFGLSVIMCLDVCFATLWAAKCPEEWSRRNPLMDYVPQNAGIYDTVYDEFQEPDCRGCHGASLADRHHLLSGYLCTDCHPVPGQAERDCRAAGCHATLDSGGHHVSNLSATMQCDACHSQLDIGGYIPQYPPDITMPYAYSCENCHWEQLSPMEGGSPIYGPQDLHHNFESNFVGNCYWCHAGNDPNNPSWDPDNEYLVRYCEKCHGGCAHSVGYSGYQPHLGIPEAGFDGWEAVGWHVDSSECGDVDPTVSRKFHNQQPWGQELCNGCHRDRF
jgi:hypothetical protein